MTKTETLRRLLGEATKGPWEAEDIVDQGWTVTAAEGALVAVLGTDDLECDAKLKVDARLTAAAVTSLPALLDVAEAARKSLAGHAGCDFGRGRCKGCDLEHALKALEAP